MEGKILLWIQENIRTDWLDPIFKVITHMGDAGIIWIALAALFLMLPKQRKMGFTCAAALIFDLLSVNVIIKKIVARPRPYVMIDGLINIIEQQSDYSFPSGHTAASFAFVSVLWMVAPKKLSVPLTILASFIAFSRLYVGVHYPTDIIGGIIIGSLCGIAAVKLVDFIYKKIGEKKKSV